MRNARPASGPRPPAIDTWNRSRATVRIALTVELTGEPTPLNLVVPFSFEVTL